MFPMYSIPQVFEVFSSEIQASTKVQELFNIKPHLEGNGISSIKFYQKKNC